MFFEIRCGDMFPGKQFQLFEKKPEPGDVVFIEPVRFVVMEVRDENGRPVVELATL